jgi:hypothetical protein
MGRIAIGVLIGLGLGLLLGRGLYRSEDRHQIPGESTSVAETGTRPDARRSPVAKGPPPGSARLDSDSEPSPVLRSPDLPQKAPADPGLMPVADPQAELVLTGTLVDSEGRIVANQSLRGELISAQGRVGAFCDTDAAGRFHWHHRGALPPAVARFEIWQQERPRARIEVWTPPLSRARIAISEPLRQGPRDLGILTLESSRLLVRGWVRDETGRPVADAEIEVVVAPREQAAGVLPGDGIRVGGFFDLASQGINLQARSYDLKSDAEGRFELRRDAPAGEIKLRARKPGRAPSRLLSVAAGTDELELQLLPGHLVHLRVRHRDGRALGPLRFELKLDSHPEWEPQATVLREASELNLHYADMPAAAARFIVRDETNRVLHDGLVPVDERRDLIDVVLD